MLTKARLDQRSGLAMVLATTSISPPSRDQLLDKIVDFFSKQERELYGSLPAIDDLDDDTVRALSIAGTAFETVDQILSTEGISTDGTVGSLMDALDLTRKNVHDLLCECMSESADHSVREFQLTARFAKIRAAS